MVPQQVSFVERSSLSQLIGGSTVVISYDSTSFSILTKDSSLLIARLLPRCYTLGRRSITVETKLNRHSSTPVQPQPLPNDPLPFDFARHGTRYRRQSRYEHCLAPDSVRHVLFMLDTSGSIGSENFESMTRSLSKLVRHFCRPIKIAAMIFNHERHLQFCFNCYDNTCTGRKDAANAVKDIRYHAGLTHTASATQCACDTILSPSCGFDTTAACLDVIYVTDGHSNDPYRSVCPTVRCLHDRRNTDMKVYAFGIGDNVNETELACITGSANYNFWGNRLFRVPTYQSFSEGIESISEAVFENPQGTMISTGCFTSHAEVEPGVSFEESCSLFEE